MSESTGRVSLQQRRELPAEGKATPSLFAPLSLLAFAHDLAWVVIAGTFAFWLAYDLGPFTHVLTPALGLFVAAMLPVQAAAFLFFRLDRGIWRFVSLADFLCIFKAVVVGTAAGLALVLVTGVIAGVPRAALVLYPIILFGGLAGSRVFLRWSTDSHFGVGQAGEKRALVLGAGAAGELLIRDMLKHDSYAPVGILDDARHKQGRAVHGIPVLGGLDMLSDQIRDRHVDAVLIAMPSAPSRVVREVYNTCARSGVSCVTLPSMSELASGRVGISRLRAVQIEDLLGRRVVEIDHSAVRGFLAGKRILVTGAGGSIGSELVRQIAAEEPSQLVLLDSGEYNLYAIEREVSERFTTLNYTARLVDIRDRDRMREVFAAHRPEVVVHAAAYKHVPLVENNPAAGVETNVLGTKVVADLAVAYGTATFVEVSTDKAVNPRNVMGASKRVAEIYCQSLDRRSTTAFITTRFGNVLGSAGSVVPLFRQQIERGGPVTVTHPDITRYFMTIPEAVSLILQAGAMGRGGEIFVLDMGEPVKIADLARQMIQLSGYRHGEDIEIVYSGLRAGEKLTEELFHAQEALSPTPHAKIMQANSRQTDWDELQALLADLQVACRGGRGEAVRSTLCRIVPEACLGEAWLLSVAAAPPERLPHPVGDQAAE